MPRTPLLLDACIAINLAATDHMQHIAEVTGFTFTLARQAAAEVGYLRDLADGVLTRTAVDLSQETSHTLQIIDLTPPESSNSLNGIVPDGSELAALAPVPGMPVGGVLAEARTRPVT